MRHRAHDDFADIDIRPARSPDFPFLECAHVALRGLLKDREIVQHGPLECRTPASGRVPRAIALSPVSQPPGSQQSTRCAPARYNSTLQCNTHGELTDDDHRWMSLPSGSIRCCRGCDCNPSLLVPRLPVFCCGERHRKPRVPGRRGHNDRAFARLFKHGGQRQPHAQTVLRALWNARDE